MTAGLTLGPICPLSGTSLGVELRSTLEVSTWVAEQLRAWWPNPEGLVPSERAGLVIATQDSQVYDRLRRTVAAGSLEPVWPYIDCRGALRRRCDSSVVVWDAGRRVAYEYLSDTGMTRVAAPNVEAVRMDAYRLVRSLVMDALEAQGWIRLHAAGVTSRTADRDGVLLIGPKGSGKSTTSVLACAEGEFDLVSNDECFVRRFGDDLIALSFPYSIGLGLEAASSLGIMPHIRQSILAGFEQDPEQSYEITSAVAIANYKRQLNSYGAEMKLRIHPRLLGAWLAIRTCQSTRVRAVVWPSRGDVSKSEISHRDVSGDLRAEVQSGPNISNGYYEYPNFLEHPRLDEPSLLHNVLLVTQSVAALPQMDYSWVPDVALSGEVLRSALRKFLFATG